MGDFIKCTNCGYIGVVETGSEECCKCNQEGCLSWVDYNNQEIDIFEDKVINMDCIEFMKNIIKDKSVDLIIEDRPYGKLPVNKVKWDLSYKIEGIFEEYNRILKDNGQIVIWGQQPTLAFVLIEALENGFEYRFETIWEKPNGMWNSNNKPITVHEQFIVLKKKGIKVSDCIFNLEDLKTDGEPYDKGIVKREFTSHNFDTSSRVKNEDGKRYPRSVLKAPSKLYMKKSLRTTHPTQKSHEIADWQVNGLSNKNSLVYIPFAGSGTEIESCIKNNRRWIATELNKEYIDEIIIPRLENIG